MNILRRSLIILSLSLLGPYAHAEEVESTKETNALMIESDSICYDGDRIILRDHVVIDHKLAHILADSAVLIRDENNQTELEYPWIELQDNIDATLYDGSIMRCGKAALDYTALTALFEPSDTSTQVYFSSKQGDLYANSAKVHYKKINDQYKPTKVTLIGDTKMTNVQASSHEQYAMAHQIEYFPLESYMILSGKGEQPVLFIDRKQNIKLAAPKVRVEKDPETHINKIYGIGKVRFTLKQDDLEQLKNQFIWK